MAIELDQKVNDNWEPLFTSKGVRYIILMGGRGAGRSYAASQFTLAKLASDEYFRCAIMRAVHSDIRLSLWQELNDRISEQEATEAIHLINNEMTAKYGRNTVNAIGFRASSGSRSAKLKSLANYNTVVIEEAEEIGEDEFRTLNDSLRTVKGDITVVFCLNTPPKSHWFIREFFDLEPSGVDNFFIPVLKEEKKEDTVFLYFNYRSNIKNLDAHTVKRYENYKNTNPEYYYHMIQGLCPETARGRIYKDWRLIDELPYEAKLVGRGMDFGWSPDPLHLCDIYYYNGGYILDEILHGTEIANETIAQTVKAQTNPQIPIRADSAEPRTIKELKKLGLNIFGAEKGQDSVIFGIKTVANLKISVTRRSTNIWNSYENYCWAETKDGTPLGIPNHFMSDPMDAARYGLLGVVGGVDPDTVKKAHAKQAVQQQERVKTTAQRHGL